MNRSRSTPRNSRSDDSKRKSHSKQKSYKKSVESGTSTRSNSGNPSKSGNPTSASKPYNSRNHSSTAENQNSGPKHKENKRSSYYSASSSSASSSDELTTPKRSANSKYSRNDAGTSSRRAEPADLSKPYSKPYGSKQTRDTERRREDEHVDRQAQRLENQQRQAAQFWREWLSEEKWYQLDRWLKVTFSKHKKFGKRDRLIYGDILFNATRFGYLAACVTRYREETGADAMAQFATQASNAKRLKQQLRQIAESKSVLDFLALCQWRAELTTFENNESETNSKGGIDIKACLATLPSNLAGYRKILENLLSLAEKSREASLVWHGIPTNYSEAVQDYTNPQSYRSLRKFLALQDSRPPLWLRVNHESQRYDVLEELNQHYTATTDNDAIAIDGDQSIYGLECYKQGWIEVQDWASQQLAHQVDCQPGDKVWDTCAGGGGKTLAIAAKLNNKGSILATDIREHKLDEVKRRAKQAQFFNIRTFTWQGDAPLKQPKEIAREGGFNWVLVDAPCSSSGTWRRNPDAKLRNLGEDLTALTQLQFQILLQASSAVKPDGYLVYGTCSFFREENEQVIEQFLKANAEFKLESQGYFGCPNKNSDTLFYARCKKIPLE